ncbi:MAG: HAD hydrolase-like protein [Alphaproteobacteria bacterium]|nr:HAD hydrolase-like protein [Alphaproteobacteria bacterium]
MRHLLLDLDDVLFDVTHTDDGNTRFYWSKDIEKDLGLAPFDSRDFFKADTFTLDVQADNEKLLQHTEMVMNSEKYRRFGVSAADFLNYYHEKNSIFNTKVYEFFMEQKRRGFGISIATNQTKRRMEFLLEKYPQLNNLAEYIFVSSTIGHLKPAPEFFLYVREKLALPFAEICMIDDKQKTIDACRVMGMTASLCFHDFESFKRQFESLKTEIIS